MAIKIGEIELATPGDLIVGGTVYGLVFAVDAFYFSGGATSAQSAGAAAAAALGAKYGIQKLFFRSTPPPELPDRSDNGVDARQGDSNQINSTSRDDARQ